MICPKCSTQNIDGSKFCIKCGSNLSDMQSDQTFVAQTQDAIFQSTQMSYSQSQQPQPTQMSCTQPQQSQSTNYNVTITKMSISECFFIILAVILKPFTAFKQELNKFNNLKNSAILSLVVSVIATLITLVEAMIGSVRVTSYWSSETKWVWENLKDINYIEVIGTNFLIYLGIIAAIACVYHIGGLIVKKQTNFSRLLGISAAAIAPMIVCSMVISPLLSMICAPLGMGATIVGGVYTVIIIYEIINNEIKLEGNAKLYFNLICMSILAIAGYYLYMKLLMGSATSGIENILDMFN